MLRRWGRWRRGRRGSGWCLEIATRLRPGLTTLLAAVIRGAGTVLQAEVRSPIVRSGIATSGKCATFTTRTATAATTPAAAT